LELKLPSGRHEGINSENLDVWRKKLPVTISEEAVYLWEYFVVKKLGVGKRI
jgi:hypothetical protein